jgi:two-component system, OmpR family, sensor kinase
VLLSFAPVGQGDWVVVFETPSDEAFGGALVVLVAEIVVILLATALALLGARVVIRRLSGSYRREQAARLQAESSASQAASLIGELQAREQLRDAFVGVISHELRTPATALYGLAKLLARNPDRDDRDELIADMEEESDRLTRIIEDLLVISRAERGALDVEREPVLLTRLVRLATLELKRRFPGVAVELDVPSDGSLVLGDEGALRQVVNNVLTNAAKYGGGRVRVEVRSSDDLVTMTVEDDGVGFPPDEAEQLFDLFYRAPSTARSASGTGIGLFVVRSLVRAMRGDVVAESLPGQGARFSITLPAAAYGDEGGPGEPLAVGVSAPGPSGRPDS